MSAILRLSSEKDGEIQRFMQSYRPSCHGIGSDVLSLDYEFLQPLHALDMMSALMDNYDNFCIMMTIEIDKIGKYDVLPHNINQMIKEIYGLYYSNQD